MDFKDILANLFGRNTNSVDITIIGPSRGETDLDQPTKVNRQLARQLYHNTNVGYSLSAQLVKPIINNNVNFVGTPELTGNKKALKVIEEVTIDYIKMHKAIELDGSIFVWPRWDDKKQKIVLWYVPVDLIDSIFVNPTSKEIEGYKLVEDVLYNTKDESNKKITITTIIEKDFIRRSITGAYTEEKTFKNFLGKIPIVPFHNDKDLHELYGHSEIENIMPQLKFYHELTYEAGAAQSRDGHPKMKITTKNVKQWIENNFGTGAYDEVRAGNKKISMEDRDLFVNAEGDDVNYLYLNKTSGDYGKLSEVCFTNIVEGSETPEINFGANIGTSLASVKEFRPIWTKKIEAKQKERTQPWLDVYELILDIYNFVNLKSLKNDIALVWPKPNFTSTKEQAEILSGFANAIKTMKEQYLLTDEEIYDTLSKLDIFEFEKQFKAHQEVIEDEIKKRKKAEQKGKGTDDKSGKTSDEGTEEEDDNNTSDDKD